MNILLKEYIFRIVSGLISETIDEVILEPKRLNPKGLSKLNLQSEGGVSNIIKVYNEATDDEKNYWGK